jgi:probable DNA repair protein
MYASIKKEALLKHVASDPLIRSVNTAKLIEVSDETAPELKKKVHSSGGVSLIKDQSACPFKAFAHHRLAARGLEEPEAGLDMRERGNMVHSCLEKVWKRVKTHQQLVELTDKEQANIIEGAVDEIVKLESHYKPILIGNFGVLEAQRLRALVSEWLQLDKARESFTIVKTEFKQAISVGDLSINTTIDRVDKLDDGSMAIIDYKTGKVSASSWFGDRPDDPQLPLYGVFAEHNVTSLGFAQVRKGECKYVGVTESDDCFSALKSIQKEKHAVDDWDSQIASWDSVLTDIANEFVEGHAAVDPTKTACAYCDLSPMCRINEQLVSGELGE